MKGDLHAAAGSRSPDVCVVAHVAAKTLGVQILRNSVAAPPGSEAATAGMTNQRGARADGCCQHCQADKACTDYVLIGIGERKVETSGVSQALVMLDPTADFPQGKRQVGHQTQTG